MTVWLRAWPWLTAGAVVLAAQNLPGVERLILIASLVAGLIALALPAHKRVAIVFLAALLCGLCVALLSHLSLDRFHYHYVWLYSAAALPAHLKISLLWGGEEGTLLFMAVLCALFAVHLSRFRGWAAPGAVLFTLVFVGAALWWNPFAPLPGEFAGEPPRGVDAHLTSVWMAVHPPLIFLAYALLLTTAGSALEMLMQGTGDWRHLAARYSRAGWLILGAGLGFGMWWAFQDFTFGAFWHWDPVQTSVFMVWALATAQLHAFARGSPTTPADRLSALLGLGTAVAVAVSMLITRNTLLASSHRYVGDTSAIVFAALAISLALVTAWGAWRGIRKRDTVSRSESGAVLLLAVLVFSGMALVSGIALAQAFVSEWLGLIKPDADKPFLATLLRWTTSGNDVAAIERAFAQWDVDGFALNRYLAPCAAAVGLLGGHAFLRDVPGRVRWACSCGTALLAWFVAAYVDPFDAWFLGRGMTSQRTVAIFFWLNAALVTAAYLAIAAAWWGARALRAPRFGELLVRRMSVGAIHLGAMLALVGAMTASVLDAYVQHTLSYPGDFASVHRLADGYSLELRLGSTALEDDGARSGARSTFSAVTEITLGMRDTDSEWFVDGSTLYRDDRTSMQDAMGPVRQLCTLLDYRYARFATDPAYFLDPFIYRGLAADVQVWVSPLAFAARDGAVEAEPSQVTVVIHRYPFLSLLWAGLVLALAGALIHSVQGWRRIRSG